MPGTMRMVVLGYSVTRGQGLAEPEKFSTQARDWLETALGRPVRLEVLAHSRAVIAPDDAHDGEPSKPGEVPSRYPSITAQARRVADLDQVDLLVVDGGINDMGAQEILNPLHVWDLQWMWTVAHTHCGRMHGVAADVIVPRFTRAPGCRHRVLSARLPN